jgi:hypothetical protein
MKNLKFSKSGTEFSSLRIVKCITEVVFLGIPLKVL